MEKCQVGDVVQLKSGGPKMTVKGANPSTKKATCVFFDGAGDFDEQELPFEVLKPATNSRAK